MPRASEIAELEINGSRYTDWTTVSVTRSGVDPFPKAVFTVASPVESAPNWSGLKLAIGDQCDVYLAKRKVVEGGRIVGRQPAYDARTHALQLMVTTKSSVVGYASVDASPGEFKNYSLEQIANAALKPYGARFYLKGSTEGAEKPFPKVNMQVGETVFDFIERLCRMRNVYIHGDAAGNLVGYRLGKDSYPIAELEEGRNILNASAAFNYTGALSEINSIGQRQGTNEHYGDDARDVKGQVKNSEIKDHAPRTLMAEMPGDAADMRMRAQHENGYSLADQVRVNVTVQGWHKDDGSLWLEHVGDAVSVFSPLLFTKDRFNLAIQEVTSTQSEGGTLSVLTLVLPGAFNGGDQTQSGGLPAGIYGTT